MAAEPHLSPGRPDAGADEDEEGGLDLAAIRDYAGFVLGAPRRHKLLAIAVLLAIFGLTRALVWALPRTYHVESTLLAQIVHIDKVASLTGQSIPDSEDAPTKLARQTVLRNDNLMRLVEETNLTKEWDRTRSPVHRIKDSLMAKLGGVPSEADRFAALVAMLESRISVNLTTEWNGEGTVTFAVDWPDPEMAFRLCTATQQNFLEARHISEIDNYVEGIALLRARAESVRHEIDAAALRIEEARTERSAPTGPSEPSAGETRPDAPRRPRPVAAPAAPPPDPVKMAEAARLKASLEGKAVAIHDLEDIRRRRLLELQARLAELRAIYADSHPLVMDTVRTIDVMSKESPQVAQLRQEETELRARYREMAGNEPDQVTVGLTQVLTRRSGSAAAVSNDMRSSLGQVASPEEGDDRGMEFLRAQLRMHMSTYDRLMERIDSVQMELDTAEAAFKYRYTVIHPAQMPNAPSKPNVGLIVAGGIIFAFLLALAAAVVADILDGRILKRWQVERI
ncbi:MAG TPA: hypothetical protein VK509_09295, partial [Polyangiales bacterium]|nr:hypothetical protein [Polyangiales bacterium]